jgi:hypothetical protein
MGKASPRSCCSGEAAAQALGCFYLTCALLAVWPGMRRMFDQAAAAAAAAVMQAIRCCDCVYSASSGVAWLITFRHFLTASVLFSLATPLFLCAQVDIVGYIPNPHYSRAKAAGA